MVSKYKMILRRGSITVVEVAEPYRMSVMTAEGRRRAATLGEKLKTLWLLHRYGTFGIRRLLAICAKNVMMSALRCSQQQLLTEGLITPEERSMFNAWEKAMEG